MAINFLQSLLYTLSATTDPRSVPPENHVFSLKSFPPPPTPTKEINTDWSFSRFDSRAKFKRMTCDLKCMWPSFLNPDFGCLARRGTVVLFGGASGRPEPLDTGVLAKGSFYVTYGVNFHFVEDPAEYSQRATELFTWLTEGKLKFSGGITVVPLSDVKKAHDMLEGRQTTGKVLLQP